jgi:hypothetical protein
VVLKGPVILDELGDVQEIQNEADLLALMEGFCKVDEFAEIAQFAILTRISVLALRIRRSQATRVWLGDAAYSHSALQCGFP